MSAPVSRFRPADREQIRQVKEQQIRPLVTSAAQIVRRHLADSSYQILLFGSWATLEAMPPSDIDIGILGDAAVDPLVMAGIHEDIDNLPTLRKIDVVDLHEVDPRFRERVLKEAERVG